jgi:hypothetical protein
VKIIFKSLVLIVFISMSLFVSEKLVGQSSHGRRTPSFLTNTKLPVFPEVPTSAPLWTDEKKKKFVLGMIDHKLSTYPKNSSRPYRVGKFAGTGLYPKFDLRDDQLKILAAHYDHNNLPAQQAHLGRILKKYNPSMKLFLYIDSGIHPEQNLDHVGIDVGNVDDQNIEWILQHHPDWILRDEKGKPIQSASGTLSHPGEYWPDPGNKEFQEFFADKVLKAMKLSGNIWDGLLIDQFFGKIENYTGYAGTRQQTRYKTDEEFQTAQIAFLKRVSERLKLPVVANLDGTAALTYPDLILRVANAGGGVENEVFPFESSDVGDHTYLPEESLKELIDALLRIPKDKHIRLNSKPGGMAGDIDRTLYAYCCYLLIAAPDRETHWTFKEGDSGIPHYWFKEFDLDLGRPMGEMQVVGNYSKDSSGRNVVIGDLWKREFSKAIVLVNPRRDHDAEFLLSNDAYDVLGRPLKDRVSLRPREAMLIVRDLSAIPR